MLTADICSLLLSVTDKVHILYITRIYGIIDYKSITSIYSAAKMGYLEIVKLMYTNQDMSHAAISGGHLNIIKYFQSVMPILKCHLETAILHDKSNIVRWILKNTELTINDEMLQIAIRNGHIEVLKYLQPVYTYQHFNTAVYNGQIDVMELIYVNCVDWYRTMTAITVAITDNPKVIKWLHSKGVDLNGILILAKDYNKQNIINSIANLR